VYCRGEEHAANGAVSSEHSNVAPSSLEKVNDAVVLVVDAAGPEPIVVCGGEMSIVHA
jgi:hypothetical protein